MSFESEVTSNPLAVVKPELAGFAADLDVDLAPRFTYPYSQPENYRFCQDSVLFPRVVSAALAHEPLASGARTLDLCAGCGVIGLELAFHRPELRQIDFLELQDEFRPHFERNRARAGYSPDAFRFLEMNYADLLTPEYAQSYDLVVANPPYFFRDEGSLSTDDLRNHCRFFLDSDFETLLRATAHVLKPGGRAYILLKSGAKHGRFSLGHAHLILGDLEGAERITVREFALLRGTLVLELTRQCSTAAGEGQSSNDRRHNQRESAGLID